MLPKDASVADGRRLADNCRGKNYLTDNSVTDLYRVIVLTGDLLYSIFFQGSTRFREKLGLKLEFEKLIHARKAC